MPPRRFNSKTRRTRRRSFSKRRGPTNKALDKKIKKLQRDQELKYVDIYQANNDITTGAFVVLLNGMVTGTDSNERIGDEVRATSIQWRMNFSSDPTGTIPVAVRMILFWDKQANGLAPVIAGGGGATSLLDTTTVTDLLLAPYNHESSDRFRVLYDKTFTLEPYALAVGGGAAMQRYITMHKKINLSRRVKYDGDTAAFTDVVTNSLWFTFMSDIAAAGINPQVEFGSRFYFKDS